MELNNRDGKIKKNRGIVELRIFKGQRVSQMFESEIVELSILWN